VPTRKTAHALPRWSSILAGRVCDIVLWTRFILYFVVSDFWSSIKDVILLFPNLCHVGFVYHITSLQHLLRHPYILFVEIVRLSNTQKKVLPPIRNNCRQPDSYFRSEGIHTSKEILK
jgi:hypothetical protein